MCAFIYCTFETWWLVPIYFIHTSRMSKGHWFRFEWSQRLISSSPFWKNSFMGMEFFFTLAPAGGSPKFWKGRGEESIFSWGGGKRVGFVIFFWENRLNTRFFHVCKKRHRISTFKQRANATVRKCRLIGQILFKGTSINYVDKQGGGRGLPKYQRYYISLFSKLVNEGGGVKDPQNSVNVVYGCTLSQKRVEREASEASLSSSISNILFYYLISILLWK